MELKNSGAKDRHEPAQFRQSAAALARHSEALKYAAVGSFLGLSWAAALRTWMVLLALEFGDSPRFTWVNTFVVILLSAAMMGGILGAAQYARRTGGSKRWRWAALAPLSMIIYPLLFMEGFIPTLLSTGEGGGAISVALAGMFGGYALAGGRWWLRLATGVLFVATVLGNVFALHLNSVFDGIGPTASQAFAALYFTQLMLLLAFGSSIPFRIRSAPAS